jgi:hypothetical protein|tara:strand:+ start:129 stop:404 length:276 start_codon:yes stop_codon:yes gene_type:complete
MNKLPFIILGVINTIIFMKTGQVKKATTTGEEWTVYGTTWCGWTTKQLEYFEKKGINHKFVDCEKSKCDGIESFPQLKSPTGEKFVGYKEV